MIYLYIFRCVHNLRRIIRFNVRIIFLLVFYNRPLDFLDSPCHLWTRSLTPFAV